MNKHVENIIAKVLAGEATKDEIDFIDNWKNENPIEFNEYSKSYSIDLFESKKFDDSIFNEKIVTSNTSAKRTFINYNNILFKIAAVFMGLALIGSLYFYNQSLEITTTNQNTELAYVKLPDGSLITLAKNSTVNYNKGWFNNFNRSVELSGKAYFEITKNDGRKFVVKTSNLDVTVLGTRFTVNELSNKTQFILTEGKVKLSGSAINETLIIDKPGNQVVVNNHKILLNEMVDQSLYSSWLNNKIYFNSCTVNEVVNMLYDSYNIKIEIDKPELKNRKLFGSAPTDDPELIVEALSQILDTKLVTGKPRE